MKCPHCYCNYDDSERECPMCGTRRGAAACREEKHKSVTYQNTRKSGGRPALETRPVQRARRHPAGNAAPQRPAASRAQPGKAVYNRGSADAAETAKKRRKKAIIAIAVVVVLNLLPVLTEFMGSMFYNLRRELDFNDDGFHFFDDKIPEPEPIQPEPEEAPAEYGGEFADGVVKGGSYYCEETDLYITLDFNGQYYWLSAGDSLEYGVFFLYGNDPGVDTSYFTDEFPASDYDCYTLYLQADEELENAEPYTMVVMYVPFTGEECPDCFYLNNTYANAQWLPLDRALLLEYW